MKKFIFAVITSNLILWGIVGCTLMTNGQPLTPTPAATGSGQIVEPPTPSSTVPPPTFTSHPPTFTLSPPSTLTKTPFPAPPSPTHTPILIITPTQTAVAAPVESTSPTPMVIIPSPTPPLSYTAPPSRESAQPTVQEATLTLNTYDYQSALIPTTPDDPIYPYPRLNHDQVGPPSPQEYRAVILENRYVQLTILPGLGGGILRWVDKASGRNLFYKNPVIKPTRWGFRGWWLATGGMEWALPVDEHGLNEASPWEYSLYQTDNNAGIILVDTEERSGLVSQITINLDASHSYFTLTPRILNPTTQTVSYKFWINGMFSLGSQEPRIGTEFVLPTNRVTIHSTADKTLPPAGGMIDWPIYKGVDYSQYANWKKYLGVFAAPSAQAGFAGAYNHQTRLGVARIFPPLLARGVKIFAPGDLDPSLWTDDGSGYFELWGG